MKRLILLPLILLTSSACHKAKTPETPNAAAELSYQETVAMCVKLHQEALKCPAEFVSMNIDLRAQYSPEFAQMMSDPAIRAEAEKVGLEETMNDGGPAAEAQCQEYAKPEWGPPTQRATKEALEGCYQSASCGEQMACVRPQIEPRFKYRAAHEQQY